MEDETRHKVSEVTRATVRENLLAAREMAREVFGDRGGDPLIVLEVFDRLLTLHHCCAPDPAPDDPGESWKNGGEPAD